MRAEGRHLTKLVQEGFLEEVALKPRQRISRGLADGRREGRVFQEGGTACTNS